ncbi:MAG TPA: macro domain-containing protein [Candidatus Methanomethylia archaeon]|nr:macro domain-containing protein [Candidatus Methanomethylicia archaeon]
MGRKQMVEIKVIRGDITELEVEAIVNPANSLLVMGGGVAGAIKRKGGREIEDKARRHAPLPVGEAVATSAGRLPAKYVIHAPTMEMPAVRTDSEKVYKAVRAALRVASSMELKEVAFPGMGTGVGGVPLKEAAETMVRAILDHAERRGLPQRVLLVAFSEDLEEAFRKAVEKLVTRQ